MTPRDQTTKEAPAREPLRYAPAHAFAWFVTVVTVVGIVVLAALGKPIPQALDIIAGVSGGGAGALSVPGR